MEGKGELLLIRLQADVQNCDLCNAEEGRVQYFCSALRTTKSGLVRYPTYLTDSIPESSPLTYYRFDPPTM